jgi:hypothetical protein
LRQTAPPRTPALAPEFSATAAHASAGSPLGGRNLPVKPRRRDGKRSQLVYFPVQPRQLSRRHYRFPTGGLTKAHPGLRMKALSQCQGKTKALPDPLEGTNNSEMRNEACRAILSIPKEELVGPFLPVTTSWSFRFFTRGRKERFPEVPAEVPLSPCPPHCRLDRHTRGALRRSTPVMFHPEDPPSRPPDCRHRSGRNNWGCRDRSERIGLHGRAPDEDETLRSRDRTVPTATRPSPRRVRGHSMIPEPIPGHPPTHPFSDARPGVKSRAKPMGNLNSPSCGLISPGKDAFEPGHPWVLAPQPGSPGQSLTDYIESCVRF